MPRSVGISAFQTAGSGGLPRKGKETLGRFSSQARLPDLSDQTTQGREGQGSLPPGSILGPALAPSLCLRPVCAKQSKSRLLCETHTRHAQLLPSLLLLHLSRGAFLWGGGRARDFGNQDQLRMLQIWNSSSEIPLN